FVTELRSSVGNVEERKAKCFGRRRWTQCMDSSPGQSVFRICDDLNDVLGHFAFRVDEMETQARVANLVLGDELECAGLPVAGGPGKEHMPSDIRDQVIK